MARYWIENEKLDVLKPFISVDGFLLNYYDECLCHGIPWWIVETFDNITSDVERAIRDASDPRRKCVDV